MMESGYNGIDTGELDAVKNMDGFLEMYRRQTEYLLAEYRKGVEADCTLEKEESRGRIMVEDCFLKERWDSGESWLTGWSGLSSHDDTRQRFGDGYGQPFTL